MNMKSHEVKNQIHNRKGEKSFNISTIKYKIKNITTKKVEHFQ